MRDTDFTLPSLLHLSQKCHVQKIAFGPWTGPGCQNKALAKTRSARHKDEKTTPSNGKENESPTRKRDHEQKLRIVWFRLEGLDMNKSTYRSFMPLEGVKRKWQGSSKKQAKAVEWSRQRSAALGRPCPDHIADHDRLGTSTFPPSWRILRILAPCVQLI